MILISSRCNRRPASCASCNSSSLRSQRARSTSEPHRKLRFRDLTFNEQLPRRPAVLEDDCHSPGRPASDLVESAPGLCTTPDAADTQHLLVGSMPPSPNRNIMQGGGPKTMPFSRDNIQFNSPNARYTATCSRSFNLDISTGAALPSYVASSLH